MNTNRVKGILEELTEMAMSTNEKARANGSESDATYEVRIYTATREYTYALTEDSNWEVAGSILQLETNKGTQWIDVDKIESIEI